jgi:hypothetical protein
MKKRTSKLIRVSLAFWQSLRDTGRKGDTFEDVIKRLIKSGGK